MKQRRRRRNTQKDQKYNGLRQGEGKGKGRRGLISKNINVKLYVEYIVRQVVNFRYWVTKNHISVSKRW